MSSSWIWIDSSQGNICWSCYWRFHKHACKILKWNKTINFQKVSKHFKLEIKPLLILQAQLKNESFVKILTTMVYVLPMENFAITITGKNILSFLYIIENLSTKFKKPKLNQLLLTNTNFSLIQWIFKITPAIWLAFLRFKVNTPVEILLQNQIIN